MGRVEILVPIALFAACFGVLYIFFVTRHRERMAMIEKGLDLGRASKPEPYSALKWGMLAVGIGLGILLGMVLERSFFPPDTDNPQPYFIMILLCGGAALIGYHAIIRRKQQG